MIDTKSFDKYLKDISDKASLKNYTEYTFRSDIENLLRDIYKGIKITEITQEGRTEDGNKPDFIISENKVPILYIETKALGESLDKIELSEQMSRYFYGYTNLVLTDYLEFRFYRNGQRYTEPIRIAKLEDNNTIIPISENFELLEKTFQQFPQDYREPIRSGSHLAKIMAGKAQRIRDNVKTFINNPDERNNSIRKIYDAFKRTLVHDLTIESFADMYAQTIVYGLFVARYYDETEDDFSRAEAMNLIPASNPFLRQFFAHIAGVEFDYRLEFIVDELCKVFSHSDVKNLLSEYFKQKTGQDPIIHFYEDFLSEYDPELKRKMGAYYTPKPVVDFIVQSVDEVLKKHFKIERGLVDSSKYESGEHMIQILDPATGTGTFFTAVLEYIKNSIKNSSQPGKWGPTYIHHDLLPRVHAFELMMTPYTISHLRASIFFERSGFTHFNNRLGIYLTNALESAPEQTTLYSDTLGFAGSIAEESKVAEIVKQDKPVMVVLGNPPYSVSSSNKGEWITDLIKVYKENLNERKINLDDDYIKFIRYSENFIEKNSKGIVAMITNNSFIDGITHRQMRKHLLETFDDIYILDLHGNSKKKEVSPDGSKDENIFDIMQGVSINIFVRRKKEKKDLGKVHHFDLYGTRQKKFEFLEKNSIGKIKWNVLDYKEPYYFFVPKDFGIEEEYDRGFSVNEIFNIRTSGIVTSRDQIVIDTNKEKLTSRISSIRNSDEEEILKKLKNTRDWNAKDGFVTLKNDTSFLSKIMPILYRPLDLRYIFFASYFLDWPRVNVMKEFLSENLGLIVTRQVTGQNFSHAQATKWITEYKLGSHDRNSYLFPLFIYENNTKQSNLNPEIVKQLEEITGKTTPENIFDYIYGVLYDPKYREKYKEFLKIDFPKIPYPKNKEIFKKYIKTGKELRELHLLESPKIEKFITSWPISGNNIVEDVKYKEEKVYINQKQYFGNVPEKVWNYYIGGYQPAQKWLKDRKGRELTNDEVDHYQKMVKSIMETINITERNY